MKNERLQQTMQKRVYCEQLYGKTMANLEGMDRFLEKFDLPRTNQEEIEIINNPITTTEIEAVTTKQTNKQTNKQNPKKLPENKSPGPNLFTGEFYQTFREELMPILLKLFQKIAEERTLPN